MFAVFIVTTPVPDKLTDPVPETVLLNVIFTLTRIFNIPPLFKIVLVGNLFTVLSVPFSLLIIVPLKLS